MRRTIRWLCITVFLIFSQQVAYTQTNVSIQGKVLEEATQKPIAGAKILLTAEHSGQRIEMFSDQDGVFSATRDITAAGPYLLTVTADRFFELKKTDETAIVVGLNAITILLVARKVESVTVNVYENMDRHLDIQHIEMSQTLPDYVINDVPAPGSLKDLKNSVATLPGVVRDVIGGLHFNGSPEDQINLLFNGFNIADPITGRLEANIGVQTVDVDLFSSRYSVEYGPGGGGTMTLNTKTGGDVFQFKATNFFPGVQTIKGVGIDSWIPHFNVSGPLKKGRVWFFAGLSGEYRKKIFIELPEEQDRYSGWNMSNVWKFQANLSTKNVLTAGTLINYLDIPRNTLSPLDPIETTVDRHAKRNFLYVKDQIFFTSRAIIEFGYGMYRSEHQEIPQGMLPYQFFDFGRRGNYFSRSIRQGYRDQLLFSALFPTITFAGTHQLKTGTDINYSRYQQDVQRTSIEYYRVDGTKRSTIQYSGGQGILQESNREYSWFLQDRWTPRIPWLLLEGGIRLDRDDGILQKSILTYRTSLAIKHPWFKNRTKFSFGYGLVPEKSNLRLLTRDQDQSLLNTIFARDGAETASWITRFSVPRTSLVIPSIDNASFGIEQRLPQETYLQMNYLRKRIRNGYAYFPRTNIMPLSQLPFTQEQPKTIITYELQNQKHESYDSVEIAIRRPRNEKRRYEWLASYSRSRARSNAAANVDTDDPIIYENRVGRMPWDTPNRLISYGLFPLDAQKKNEIRYFLEWRDGFPYTVYDGEYQQYGLLNSWRLPRYFTLNIQFGKKVTFLNRLWELRAGVDNITNRDNAMLAIQNIESPLFGTYFGKQPRRYVFGVRLLDKKKTK